MSINTKNIYNQPLSLENVSQNVIPTDDGAYDIGSATKKWNGVYASTIHYTSLDPPITGGGGGGSSQWTTSGTTIYYNTGSVGIGTTTPAYKLTTYGTSDTGMSIKNAQTSTEWGLASGSGAFSSDALSGDTVLRSGSGRRLILQSGGGSSSILINSSGSVGIGSNNPIAKLDISQEARTGTHATHNPPLYITGTLGSASDGVEIRHTNGTQGIGFGFNSIYASGSNANQDINAKRFW